LKGVLQYSDMAERTEQGFEKLRSEINAKIDNLLADTEGFLDGSKLAGYNVPSTELGKWHGRPLLGETWRDNKLSDTARLILSSNDEADKLHKSVQVHVKPENTDGSITWVYYLDIKENFPRLRAYQNFTRTSDGEIIDIPNDPMQRPIAQEDLEFFSKLLDAAKQSSQ